jgi:uncharacterized protein with PIN domain
MKSKHKNTYPYEWYVYKDDSDACPECGNKPRDYHVKPSHPAIHLPVIFECANGHKWTEATIKIKNYDDVPMSEEYETCPRCNENAFKSDGFQQDTDGQYSHYWSCRNCNYTETL